jgi:hypothetical protein
MTPEAANRLRDISLTRHNGANESMSETTSDPKERQILEAGIDYVFERSDGQECPFCGARMGIGEEANPKAMKSHLRGKHPQQCTMALAQDSLNPVIVEKVTEDDLHAMAGIQLAR